MEASAAVSRAPVGAAVPALAPARYTDPGAVAMLAPVWDRLSTSPMQHTIWAQAWLDVFGKDHRLRFFAAGAPDAPAAIAPLVARLRGPERLELLGGELHEETDVLGTDVEALDAMARDLAARPPELRGGLVEEAFSVEAASWKGEKGTGLAAAPARGAFYRRYAEAAA